MDRSQIVRALQEMADLIEVESESPFRARSFRAGARALDGLAEDFSELVESGRLREIRGIGESLAGEILEIYQHGESRRYRQLLGTVPGGVRDMLRVSGLGPKKVRALWKKLGISGIGALEKACSSGEVASLSGFGARSAEKILAAIEQLRSASGKFLIPQAEVYVEALREVLGRSGAVERLEVAGSYRRRKEIVKDLDFLVSTEDPERVGEHFSSWEGVVDVALRGSTKVSVRFENGLAADLRMVRDEHFPFALAYFTGSKEHNTSLRARAKELGFKLNEYGLFPEGKSESLPLEDEAAIFRALGLAYIPPELREDFGEIDVAARGEVPALVEDGDLRGVVHVHTTYSDGRASLEEMVDAARQRGYSYLGITDHSQSAFYAGGLREEDVVRQHEEIDRLNGELRGFRLFKGIESDIRPDGSLDYPPEVLDRFDFVVASLHSSLGQSEKQMTARVLRALEDPHTTILGHATGRLLLRREPAALDMEQVLRAAAECGVAVEINANPHRLDLDWRHGRRARELGLHTCIAPDAHSPEGMDDVRYGVGIARKGGFEAARVINARDADGFAEFIARRKRPGR